MQRKRNILISIVLLAALILAIVPTTAQAGRVSNPILSGNVSVDDTAKVTGLTRKLVLGAPALLSATSVVATGTTHVGAFTLTGTTGTVVLDVPRNLIVVSATNGTADTLGTLTIVGTDISGIKLSETFTVATGTTAGTKAFKTVTSVTGAGGVATDGGDTITVGHGNRIGLPITLSGSTGLILSTLGTTVGVYPTTGTKLSTSTVDASAATYDGAKVLTVYGDQ